MSGTTIECVQLMYSVDRAYNNQLQAMATTPPSKTTRWHRARPEDEGLAACDRRIVLNTEDAAPVGDAGVGELCRRCFR